MEHIKRAIEENAWDGNWYRRAYFDDGTPLGSASNEECRIDSIAQSWAVLSGAGDSQRARLAMAAVDEYLIDRGEGLVKIFAPPFDESSIDPGYIKGYVPGVRENGGQYTHAAIWTLMAFAALGDGDRAGELYALLNPINHSATRAGLHKYKVEPYVTAADIYGMSPHVGRGGWTWYTGSASWMYRAGLESILGFRLSGDQLRIDPCIPKSWKEFEIFYKRGRASYSILVSNRKAQGALHKRTIELDGIKLDSEHIQLVDDGKAHNIRVQL
jgi:cyclic beta-1,2-glucan synthetase